MAPSLRTGYPFAVCIILALFLCGSAQGAHVFVRSWGANGSANGQFFNPEGIAVDPIAGTVWVADSGNNRTQSFTPAGVYQSQFGSFGAPPGQFWNPVGIAVNNTGFVYVGDSFNSRTQVYTTGGVNVTFFTSGAFPNWGVATNSTGYVYETLPLSSTTTIELTDPSGAAGSALGPFGAGPGQFNNPTGIAVNASGYLYVADTNNNRIEILDPSGNFLGQWGTAGAGNGQFSVPYGVAVDTAGNVYVADSGNWRIQEFSPSGVYIEQWGTNGVGPGQFGTVTGVAADGAGNIFTIDTALQRVQEFAPAGPIPTASFTGSPLSGTAPLNVIFTDSSTSIAPLFWNWSFGDGGWYNNSNPAFPNADHTFTAPGTYTVTMTISNSSGNSTLTRTDYITVVSTTASLGLGGDNSDNGPPPAHQTSAPTPTATTVPVSPSATPTPPPIVNANPLSLTYPLGFDGLDYNTGGSGTLSLSRSKARAAGADITMYFDRLEVYQHHSPGVRITFWGTRFNESSDTITGPVTRAEFTTDPFRPTLSSGAVSVSVHAALESLSGPGAISTTVNGDLPPDIADRYRSLAEENGLGMEGIAYTLAVSRANISRTAPANISMSVPASWVAANGGQDAVRIGRISDETGAEELLVTVFTGTDPDGNLVFRGDSPNGTSLFGLLTAEATAEEQKAHPNVTYVSVSQSAMVTNAGMFGWLLGMIEAYPVLLVLVAAIVAAAAYFGWWRRRL